MPDFKAKFVGLTVVGFVIILLFQNCGVSSGGGIQDITSTGSTGSSVSVTGGSTSTGTGTGDTTMTTEQRQSYCLNLVGTPTVSAESLSNLTMKIGMGSAPTGDVSSATNVITGNASISNKVAFDEKACAGVLSLMLRCEVVEGDTARPIAFSKAYDISGANAANGGSAATLANVARKIYRADNCQPTFSSSMIQSNGAVSFNSRMVSAANNPDSFRCVDGSFYIRYVMRSTVGNTNKSSSPLYAKVTVQNGCWDPVKLNPAQALTRTAKFGSAVTVDGNWAAVAAETDAIGATTRVGSVSIFEKISGSWTFRQKIILPSAAADETVKAVALKGTKLFIGSPFKHGTGAVYHYERSGSDFILVNEVTRPDYNLDSQEQMFGHSLAFNGSILAVGGPHYSEGTVSRSGRVYIYSIVGSSATHQQTLVHSDANRTNKGFGWSLSLTASHLAIGAPQAATKESLGKGDVSIFSLSGNTFSFVKKISSSVVNNGAVFGFSVALNGNRLLVGAPWFDKGDSVNFTKSGGVFYFPNFNTASASNPNWTGEKDFSLGQVVGFSSQGVLMSAPGGNARRGFINHYLFTELTSTPYQAIALDTVINDALGSSFAVSGSDIIVGAAGKSDPLEVTGAAYGLTIK